MVLTQCYLKRGILPEKTRCMDCFGGTKGTFDSIGCLFCLSRRSCLRLLVVFGCLLVVLKVMHVFFGFLFQRKTHQTHLQTRKSSLWVTLAAPEKRLCAEKFPRY